MMNTARSHTSDRNPLCLHCGKALVENRTLSRFCSLDCLMDFRNSGKSVGSYGSDEGEEEPPFMLSEEIDRLRSMVVNQKESHPQNDLQDINARIAFYEQVIQRTGRALHWINTSARLNEQASKERYEEVRRENSELNRKLDTLLLRAAELKKENKNLKAELENRAVPEETEEMSIRLARKLLGIKDETDPKKIKKAYRLKARNLHPDRQTGDADIFKALTDAMVLLMEHCEDNNLNE